MFVPYFSLFNIIHIRQKEKIHDSYDKCEPGLKGKFVLILKYVIHDGISRLSGHMETRIKKYNKQKESYIGTRSPISFLETSRFCLDVLLMRAAM